MYHYCSHFTIRGIETQRDDASWSRSYDKWYIVIGTVWCPYRLPWWLRWYSICYVAFLYYNFFSWEDLLHLAIIPTWQQPPQDKWQMALWFTSASPVRSLILPAWPLWALSTWQQVPKFYLWTRPSSELHGILASYPLNTWMSHRELKLYTTETPPHTHPLFPYLPSQETDLSPSQNSNLKPGSHTRLLSKDWWCLCNPYPTLPPSLVQTSSILS